ncbi:MAG: acetyl-CoA carboxylase biotin carboxyl carrier protein [Gemmatimonadetes bacterium]|nr:acetyl-CoA carboxylase biotin carboxyl carrier protein [Gemmatimonadota bacterium]MCZ6759194.1 acetyl-CoA carboxylase biotin carboxyl carrier protein [Gemmatimonadota bacterium]
MIDFEFLEKLLDLLNRSGASTIEIRKWPWSTSVKVSKVGDPGPGGPATYQVSQGAQQLESRDQNQAVSGEPEAGPALTEIKSPMVGTFYAQPEPGAGPYVSVGSRISPGKTLCVIEAMKIMNPLDAEISGVIRETCVEDAQPVEFGQVLFRVDSNG